MAEGFTPIEIFCSYAHEDEVWLCKLEKHLRLLKRQGLISLWYDRLILPGADWTEALDAHLETASLILLLVSANFFASDYCYGIEMQRALEREATGEARVLPILVRPADWKGAPFADLQALPADAKPITSWQNKDAALADVAAGIRRVIVEELPQLVASAPRAALPKIWNVPYPRNPFFLGRDDELAQLHSYLQAGQATALAQPQAISGLGGIGKTQLALEYAYRYRQNYQMVLWARAESTEALVSSYVAIAQFLQLPERKAKEQDIIVQAVKTWLQTHHGWLFVLDNADELKVLLDFLPSAPGGHLLLTTQAAVTGRLAYRLEIETLLPEQGALLLLRRAGLIAPNAELSHVSGEERELALQVSLELGGLPLALDQAGAYLEETGASLIRYWQIYQQRRVHLLQRRGGLVGDHPESVATTWSLSFQKVKEKNPAAADLLRICAYLAPDGIPGESLRFGLMRFGGPILAPIAQDAFLFNQVMETLRAYSLVQLDPHTQVLSIHRLVQAILRESLEEGEQRCEAERAVLVVHAAFSARFTFPINQPDREQVLPHALLAAQWSDLYQINRKEVGWLFVSLGSYHLTPLQEAESLAKRALTLFEQWSGAEHPDIANVLHLQGRLCSRQGKYPEAEHLYQQALAINELQPNPFAVVGSLQCLARCYFGQQKYVQAQPLFQRVLALKEHRYGSEDRSVFRSLQDLAETYSKQGKYALAEPLYQRELRIWEQQPEPRTVDGHEALRGLAEIFSGQRRFAEAEEFYQRALAICEQQRTPRYDTYMWHTLEIMYDLAQLHSTQGNHGEAEIWSIRALTICEQELGTQHSKTTETRMRLIALLQTMGQHEKVAKLEEIQSES